MVEIEGRGCTLKCYFSLSAPYKPTRAEMLHWLENKSGLSKDYFEKILEVKYDTENICGLEVAFRESVNCFIAIRQVKNRIVHSVHGTCKIFMKCPKGSFEFIKLIPDTANLLSKDAVVEAIKSYGEIIDMHNVFWYDSKSLNKISTGDICARILTKKKFPCTLEISGVKVEIEQLSYKVYHNDEIIQELWESSKSDLTIDYSAKSFQMIEEKPGCRIICKFNNSFSYIPNQTDVYGWLTSESCLSEETKKKILVFKKISEVEYHILFDHTVNCLLAIREIKNCKVYHSHNVYHNIKVSCSRGKFVNICLIPKNSNKILSKQDVENMLSPYGVVAENQISNTSELVVSNGEHSTCIFFMTKDTPEIISEEVNIVMEDCNEDLDEKVLRKVWNIMINKNLVKCLSVISV